MSYLAEHLKRHQIDGIGDRSDRHWDSDEIMIFNPSKIKTLTAHKILSQEGLLGTEPPKIKLSNPVSNEELQRLAIIDKKELEEFEND